MVLLFRLRPHFQDCGCITKVLADAGSMHPLLRASATRGVSASFSLVFQDLVVQQAGHHQAACQSLLQTCLPRTESEQAFHESPGDWYVH